MFRRVDADIDHRLGSLVRALPGTRALLARCVELGIKTAVVTNDVATRAERTLAAAGLAVDVIAGSDLVAHGKPAPDLARFALAKLGVDPNDAVCVGDHPHDIDMAKAAGIARAIAVLTGTSDAAAFARTRSEGGVDVVAGLDRVRLL